MVSIGMIPDAPFFTIVVATFDRGRHIVPTIEAALDQTFKDFEIIVVADGETGDTLSYVPRDYPRVAVVGLPRNSGSQAVPNNVGIAIARGRHIAYLGHDDQGVRAVVASVRLLSRLSRPGSLC